MVNTNPILDTCIYNMELLDGWVQEYSVNYILENIYEQVNENGWDMGFLKEIMYPGSNTEVAILQGEYDMVEFNGIKKLVITMKGWDFQFRWKDQSTDWIHLKLVKKINPIKVEQFVIANGCHKEP